MGTAQGMIRAMEAYLGMGEPNRVQEWYRKKHGSAYDYNFPWCDALVTKAAHDSDNVEAVLPGGDRAYTVWHAEDFARKKKLYAGTAANLNKAKPGDLAFFDWGGTDNKDKIDHIGIVVRSLGGGRIETIEGNTYDQCLRRVRSWREVSNLGKPDYDDEKPPAKPRPGAVTVPNGTPILRKKAYGHLVTVLQKALIALGHKLPRYGADGKFGAETEKALKAFQVRANIQNDGEYGEESEAAMRKAVAKL